MHYATDAYFDQADRGDIGRWPSGTWLADGEGSSETLMATVSLDEQGIYRVERGPAGLFWQLTNPPDDDDES